MNSLITKLTDSSYRNEVTNGFGYTVNKLRIYLPRTTNPTAALNSESYSQLIAAGQAIGTDYLTDNPSRASNVLGSISQSTDGFGMLDGLHYNGTGYSSIGLSMSAYFSNYINE